MKYAGEEVFCIWFAVENISFGEIYILFGNIRSVCGFVCLVSCEVWYPLAEFVKFGGFKIKKTELQFVKINLTCIF